MNTALPFGDQPALQRTNFGQRHQAARQAVLASQRGRIIEGIVEAAAQKGYQAITLADIAARARVSRTTFYEHFDDKEDAFVAAIETSAAILMGRIAEEAGRVDPQDWRTMMETRIGTYCDTLVTEPDFARVVLVEALKAGDRAVAARQAAIDAFAVQYRVFHDQARQQNPDIPLASDHTIQLIVDAIAEHSRRLITDGTLERLRELTPEITEFAYRVLGIPHGARDTRPRDQQAQDRAATNRR
jgi:AcrR family transcriptional regulator